MANSNLTRYGRFFQDANEIHEHNQRISALIAFQLNMSSMYYQTTNPGMRAYIYNLLLFSSRALAQSRFALSELMLAESDQQNPFVNARRQ